MQDYTNFHFKIGDVPRQITQRVQWILLEITNVMIRHPESQEYNEDIPGPARTELTEVWRATGSGH